jgi:hypothetical protein
MLSVYVPKISAMVNSPISLLMKVSKPYALYISNAKLPSKHF